MSISSIGGSWNVTQTQQLSGVSSANNQVGDADGDHDGGGRVQRSGGKFTDALSQALAQLGITGTTTTSGVSAPDSGTTSTTSSSSATDSTTSTDTNASAQRQAVAAFAQSLFAALQSQISAQNGSNSGSNSNSSSGNSGSTASVTATGGHHGHHHGGGISQLETGLQNLIQQLSSSASASSGNSGSATSGSSTSASTSSSTLDALQQSFSNLLTAEGKSGSNVNLTTFLQTLNNSLHGAAQTGNIVTSSA